jgi:flagellar FliL protein
MRKILLTIFNIITQILLIGSALVSLATGYIVFAPDDFPKPFHLLYNNNITPMLPSIALPTQAAAETPTPEPHIYAPGEGVMVNMSTKIINLMDPGGRRYIRVTIVVEFAPDNPDYQKLAAEAKTAYLTQFQDKLNSLLPIMDDTAITLLSTKTYEDLYTADGKEKLRQELMNTLSQKLPELHIISIYFTEFVVQ